MASALHETLEILRAARKVSSSILVGYSDGKDSRAIMELCKRTFDRVEAFYMYSVPGLACIDEALVIAAHRYGLPPIRQYPHWALPKWIADGIYCNSALTFGEVPDWSLRDIYDCAMADTGIPLIASGAKRADSMWRRRMLATGGDYDDVIYPIVGWKKVDVLGYLMSQGISIPNSSGRSATGIDFSVPSLLWLHDTYPEDFRKVCELFPYAEAVIWRRKWHGVTA